jgi:hypothetical protein
MHATTTIRGNRSADPASARAESKVGNRPAGRFVMQVTTYRVCIMCTTVSISDELLAAAKRRARERGISLGEVIDAALRRELTVDDRADHRPVVPVFDGGSRPRAGVDLTSNRALHEALDEGGCVGVR